MSRFRYFILPRLLLALSSLALLASLFLLWLSLERPLPFFSLACRQAASANCFTGGALLASGAVYMEEARPTADAWAVLRSGNQYARVELHRTAGILWSESGFDVLGPKDETLFTFSAAISDYPIYGEGDSPFFPPEFGNEQIPLAICTDPSVVRLEGELLWLGSWENPQEALASRGMPVNWSLAGNGVWVGDAVTSSLPAYPDGTGNGGTLSIWCRGYDAAGNMVCHYDPTE